MKRHHQALSCILILILVLTSMHGQRHVEDPRITILKPHEAQELGGSHVGSSGSFKAQCWLVKAPEADAGWGRTYSGGTRITNIHSLAYGTTKEELQIWIVFSDATIGPRDREAVVADLTLLDSNGLVIARAKDCPMWTSTEAFDSPESRETLNYRQEYPHVMNPNYCLGECFFSLEDMFTGALPGIFEARITVKDIHGDQSVDLVLPIEIKE